MSGAVRRGFTLIELLVVVAIIALLIAILLPALGRAREQSRAVACGANLRSFGQAAYTYATEWDGYVLRGDLDSKELFWPLAFARYLGQEEYTGNYGQKDVWTYLQDRRIFRCPSLNKTPFPLHYTANNMPFHLYNPTSNTFQAGVTPRATKLVNLGVAPSTTAYMGECHDPAKHTEKFLNVMDVALREHTNFGNNLRLLGKDDKRHMGNTTIVFFDGHTETRKMTWDNVGYQVWNPFDTTPQP